jgi:hypothetical protein
MKQSIEVIKEMVDQEVFQKVDKGTDSFQKAANADRGYQEAQRAVQIWKKNPKNSRWEIRINCDGTNIYQSCSDYPFSDLIGAAIQQLLELLSAIHFTERHEAIKEFNKSLEG